MRSVVVGVAGVVCGIALVATCGTPSDSQIGRSDATPGNPVSCTPAESFCDGNKVWTCTYSGKDAFVGVDCATQGSATNPGSCATSGCPAGAKACCRPQLPIGKWNFSQPALVGETYSASAGIDGISLSTTKICVGRSGFGLYMATLQRSAGACALASTLIHLRLERDKLPDVGVTYSFPTIGVYLVAVAGDVTCNNWTGTLRLDSDLPTWSVTINATCADAGKGSFKVIGTMSGNE